MKFFFIPNPAKGCKQALKLVKLLSRIVTKLL